MPSVARQPALWERIAFNWLTVGGEMAAIVDFYYGLGSRYSYLAATQIDALEREHGARVAWHPLTSGALMDMRRQNPFRGEPVSGQYDWAYRRRDAEDWANLYGVPFIEPVGRIEFDRDLPALACLAAKRLGEEVAYSREMFRMMFAEERTRLTRDDALDGDRRRVLRSVAGNHRLPATSRRAGSSDPGQTGLPAHGGNLGRWSAFDTGKDAPLDIPWAVKQPDYSRRGVPKAPGILVAAEELIACVPTGMRLKNGA